MKKIVSLTLWSIPLFLLLYSALMFQRSAQPRMPSFKLLLSDSITIFNTINIPEGRPCVLLFFSPDCEHCQAETESILQNMDSLKNVNFYFVTIEPFGRMKLFNEIYKISRYQNIMLGRDYTFYFPWYFKNAQPPYLVIYDRYKREKGIFSGGTEARSIIAYINQL
jgi:hypothetical protein